MMTLPKARLRWLLMTVTAMLLLGQRGARALEISVGAGRTQPGNTVQIPITLSQAPTNLSAFAFYVTNAPGWPLPTVAADPSQSQINCFVDGFSNGVCRVTAFVLTDPPIGNGPALVLHYSAPVSAAPGTYPLLFPATPPDAPVGPNPEARTLVYNADVPAIGVAGSILILGPRPLLTHLQRMPTGFQFEFDAQDGTNFTVLTSTNAAAPVSNWQSLGHPVPDGPNHFQFIDPSATNGVNRFYMLKE